MTAAIPSIVTAEDQLRALEKARLEGYREGETKASLDRLFQQSRDQSQLLMTISEKLTVFQAEVTRQQQLSQEHARDIAEMKADIVYLKQNHVRPEHLADIAASLKDLSTQVNGFFMKLALSALGGGGVVAGLTYGVFKITGVL